MNDLRFAFRVLAKNSASTLMALLSLGVAIGANTAIFSLVNDSLLRPLPVPNPDELVLLRNIDGAGGRMSRAGENNGAIDPVTGRAAPTSFSLLNFERMRAQPAPLSQLFAFAPFSQVNILIDGVPEIASSAQMVSGNYHTGLDVSAVVGRTLTVRDDDAAVRRSRSSPFVTGNAGSTMIPRFSARRLPSITTIYLPSLQQVDGDATFDVRLLHADRNPGPYFAAIRAAVRDRSGAACPERAHAG
jgi:hypothetical protein